MAGFLEQNERVRKATFKEECSQEFFSRSWMGWAWSTQPSSSFAGSAVFINDKSIETSTALGLIVMFAQFSQQYYQPIIQVAASWGSLQLAFTGAERIQEMFDAEEEIRPETPRSSLSCKKVSKISHIDFSYLPDKPILKDVSISAPKGQMTAVVGPTGSGKTTIMNLINRFYDVDAGGIYFDGKDIP